uniref:Migration and invasion enhancer 1 n=1 Tax=Papilio xuthus TaxID=66420 RepID=I4DLK6_PAPXU|nr:migration and invasion enhancer 1 [Papilio xuthus]BAM18796.1 unknown unsecreted protein [Papilio xuthus]
MERLNENKDLKVQIEYCGACDYGGHCLALANAIKKCTPNAVVLCKRGRQGSFEILINDKLIYSKLQTMALPMKKLSTLFQMFLKETNQKK